MKQMFDRLVKMLCGVKCKGEERWEGGCIGRADGECVRIKNLEMCMVNKIADNLIGKGVIVPPCKAGDMAYHLTSIDTHEELNVAEIFEGKVCSISKDEKTLWIYCRYNNGLNYWYTEKDIGRKLFFVREEAEQALKGAQHEE